MATVKYNGMVYEDVAEVAVVDGYRDEHYNEEDGEKFTLYITHSNGRQEIDLFKVPVNLRVELNGNTDDLTCVTDTVIIGNVRFIYSGEIFVDGSIKEYISKSGKLTTDNKTKITYGNLANGERASIIHIDGDLHALSVKISARMHNYNYKEYRRAVVMHSAETVVNGNCDYATCESAKIKGNVAKAKLPDGVIYTSKN